MVEGSQIDFACHAGDSAWMVDETVDFSNAVQVALDYAKTHDNTLVVVTADHETGKRGRRAGRPSEPADAPARRGAFSAVRDRNAGRTAGAALPPADQPA